MKSIIIQSKWDIDEAEAVYWIAPEAAWAMTVGMRKIYGLGFNRNVVIFEQGKPFKWCTLISELDSLGKKLIIKFGNEKFRKRIWRQYLELKNCIDKEITDYRRKNPSQLSVNQLLDYLLHFTVLYRQMFSYGFFAEPLDYVFSDFFPKALRRYRMSDEEIKDLGSIPYSSYLNLETQDLIRIAIKKKHGGADVGDELLNHLRKYEWVATGHDGKQHLNLNFFGKRVEEMIKSKRDLNAKLLHLSRMRLKIKREKRKLIKKYSFNSTVISLIKIIDDAGSWHDLRKELFVKTIYYADDIREELGRRFGYTLSELQLFTFDELLPLREGKNIDRRDIKRRQAFIFLDVDYKKKRFKVYSGKKYKKLVTRDFISNSGSVDEVSGSVASGGRVTGLVKVVFGKTGFSKMKKGDILVTGMTRPEMMPIMKKAAAIITDEGGITCHAAIVSRELSIPCIVGTKIATKILRDGDRVEVDAISGVVRKL